MTEALTKLLTNIRKLELFSCLEGSIVQPEMLARFEKLENLTITGMETQFNDNSISALPQSLKTLMLHDFRPSSAALLRLPLSITYFHVPESTINIRWEHDDTTWFSRLTLLEYLGVADMTDRWMECVPPSLKMLNLICSEVTRAGLGKLATTIESIRMVNGVGFKFGFYNRFTNLQDLECWGNHGSLLLATSSSTFRQLSRSLLSGSLEMLTVINTCLLHANNVIYE